LYLWERFDAFRGFSFIHGLFASVVFRELRIFSSRAFIQFESSTRSVNERISLFFLPNRVFDLLVFSPVFLSVQFFILQVFSRSKAKSSRLSSILSLTVTRSQITHFLLVGFCFGFWFGLDFDFCLSLPPSRVSRISALFLVLIVP